MFDRFVLSAFEKACHWMQIHLEGLDLFQLADLVRWPITFTLVISTVYLCSGIQPHPTYIDVHTVGWIMACMVFIASVDRRANTSARQLAYDAAALGLRNPIEVRYQQLRMYMNMIFMISSVLLWYMNMRMPYLFPALAFFLIFYVVAFYIQSVTPLSPSEVQRAREAREVRHMTPANIRD